jgi:hypothetical protein
VNKKNYISSFLIGLFFLTIYVNVLFTQVKCNFSHLSEFFEHQNTLEHHHHDDNDDNDVLPLAEHSHSHNDSKDGGCCNDKTSAFFSSITTPSSFVVDFKNPITSNFFTLIPAVYHFCDSQPNSTVYFSSKAPPPKISDIRVFIHSFTI